MRKISEILRQIHYLKRSHREVAQSLGISPSTVGYYLGLARAAELSWPLPAELDEETLYQQLTLPVASKIRNRPEPDWVWVHQELRKKGMTLKLLWREWREQCSTGIGYAQFCIQYQRFGHTLAPTLRIVHKAGEKAFVDYAGMTVPWLDTTRGPQEAQIFVGCLGASQFTFAEATATQSLPDWCQSHVHFFDALGGVPHILVPDNLKAGVTKPHRYDPDINPNYQRLGEHYGVAIIPARVVKPKDKAKVENAVLNVERTLLAPLRHCTFTSLAQINAALKERLDAFNRQRLQGLHVSRWDRFQTLDKPALQPLPVDRFVYATWKKAKVPLDYHVLFEGHHYSVPYRYLQQSVDLCAGTQQVEVFYKGQRIACHPRSDVVGAYSTCEDHRPKAHQAYREISLEQLLQEATQVGEATVNFLTALIAARTLPQQAYRACEGILRLGKRYGNTRLEKACRVALEIGATRYQPVALLLKNRLEDQPLSRETAAIPPHDNLRGADYYAGGNTHA